MKKTVLWSLLFLFASLNLFCNPSRMSTPVMSRFYPDKNVNALLLNAPQDLVAYFESMGIDPRYMSKDRADLPYEIRMQICEVCRDCQDEVCKLMLSIAAPYEGIYYDAIVLKIGDLYWTIWT